MIIPSSSNMGMFHEFNEQLLLLRGEAKNNLKLKQEANTELADIQKLENALLKLQMAR